MKQKAELTSSKVQTNLGTARFMWKTLNGSQYGLLVRESWNRLVYSYDGGKTWFKSAKDAVYANGN